MGLVNSIFSRVEEKQKEAAVKNILFQLKLEKKKRDYMIATKMATTRDRVKWMTAFYLVMGGVSFGRMIHLRKFTPLPLNVVPFVLVPFLVAYQFDFAYGSKANRIDREARVILNEEEGHWFNEPMEIPVRLKPHYLELFEENVEVEKKIGGEKFKMPNHWAK